MRRRLFYTLFILMLFGVGILAELSKLPRPFTFDENGNYTGFHDIPENYTVEQARQDGCVIHDSLHHPEIDARQDPIWKKFVEKSTKGQNASVRIMFLFQEDVEPTFQDVFFQDGSYCAFKSSAHLDNQCKRRNFPYLLERSGRLPNASRDGSVVVLSLEEKDYTEICMDCFFSADAYTPDKYVLIYL